MDFNFDSYALEMILITLTYYLTYLMCYLQIMEIYAELIHKQYQDNQSY